MKIFVYGDSNTYGWVPNVNGYSKHANVLRYQQSDIWWHPLSKENELVVDGLPGRAIFNDNPWLDGRNATITMQKDFENQRPDVVIFQLGTNDCKSQYNLSARDISEQMSAFVQKAKVLLHNPKIVIISPARIVEGNKITDKYYKGGEKKSVELDKCYKEMCKKNNFVFVSGIELQTGEDGEHLTNEAHRMLGQKVLTEINRIAQNNKTK